MDKRSPEELEFEVGKLRNKTIVFVFSVLSSVVIAQNMAPLILSIYRRPPDATVAGVKESNLLLTGALVSIATLAAGQRAASTSNTSTETETRSQGTRKNDRPEVPDEITQVKKPDI